MVVRQILDLSVLVRIQVGQQKRLKLNASAFFIYFILVTRPEPAEEIVLIVALPV
jgi:hypothetical protein